MQVQSKWGDWLICKVVPGSHKLSVGMPHLTILVLNPLHFHV